MGHRTKVYNAWTPRCNKEDHLFALRGHMQHLFGPPMEHSSTAAAGKIACLSDTSPQQTTHSIIRERKCRDAQQTSASYVLPYEWKLTWHSEPLLCSRDEMAPDVCTSSARF